MTSRSKIWLLGGPHTGKTSFLQCLLTNSSVHSKLYRQTAAPEVSLFKKKSGEIYVLDIPGDDIYFDIAEAHLDQKDASGIIFCYDVTDKDSLSALRKWMAIWRNFDKERPQHNGLLPVALVAMKTDLVNRRLITNKQGETLAENLKTKSGAKNVKYTSFYFMF